MSLTDRLAKSARVAAGQVREAIGDEHAQRAADALRRAGDLLGPEARGDQNSSADPAESLRRLAALRESGSLTDAEFEQAKRQLIKGM